jgi:hypothetical protein
MSIIGEMMEEMYEDQLSVKAVNNIIQSNKKVQKEEFNIGQISDGYHTFDELYEHRIELWITVCKLISTDPYSNLNPWKTTVHSDGSVWNGWFLLGIEKEPGKQITYHLPMSRWEECFFAETLDKAPLYDNHSSNDVLQRLKTL